MREKALPQGISEIQVTRYIVDGLDGQLFETPEQACQKRAAVEATRAMEQAVMELMKKLRPGPKEPGQFVEQDADAVSLFREQANALLVGVDNSRYDWNRLVQSNNRGLGKMPLAICAAIMKEEGMVTQPLCLCYYRLAKIDKYNREWRTPKEAEMNSKRKRK